MHPSRRKFLGSVAAAGATVTLKPPAWAFEDVDSRVTAIVASTIGIDTHNHIDVPLTTDEVPGPTIDLAGEMKRSRVCPPSA